MRRHDTGRPAGGRVGEVLAAAAMLGLTSFGGPIAHLGYFHREYVARRRWVSEAEFADLVAVCQVLPGPASSQVGIAVGLLRAGWPGAIAAWIGFTLPSAVLLTAFALAATDLDLASHPWVHGLKLAAIAIVAAAIVSMWRTLAPDPSRRILALGAAAGILVLPASGAVQVGVIAAGSVAGWVALSRLPAAAGVGQPPPVSRRTGTVAAATLAVLLVGLPVLATVSGSTAVAVVEAFHRAGALVFGGGHVVLPLLSESVVVRGWVDGETFLAGYGAAQAVPGPLFTFAAYLGASLEPEPNGIAGAAVALVAIFLPSFLLVTAALAFWAPLRRAPRIRGALAGAAAAVVGLLIAALVDPLWLGTVRGAADVALVAVGFGALVGVGTPPWSVVVGMALAAQTAAAVGLG